MLNEIQKRLLTLAALAGLLITALAILARTLIAPEVSLYLALALCHAAEKRAAVAALIPQAVHAWLPEVVYIAFALYHFATIIRVRLRHPEAGPSPSHSDP
jgi:hypothetical protein